MTVSNSVQIIASKDGSNTLYHSAFNETYHSRHGAKTESMHVFIQNGLRLIEKPQPVVLEIGMGTGLNVLLTRQYQKETPGLVSIVYHTLEMFPIPEETVKALQYTHGIADDDAAFFYALHKAQWNVATPLTEDFTLFKIKHNLLDFTPSFAYDVVYFDAFAPNTQPQLWDKKIFQRLFEHLNEGGVLCTYCAKGQVRRDLIEVGFRVERRPGPPGKREMIVAFKDKN